VGIEHQRKIPEATIQNARCVIAERTIALTAEAKILIFQSITIMATQDAQIVEVAIRDFKQYNTTRVKAAYFGV